ncbi:hypothetical protein PISL3812_07647 [Talaromyces islandicus]|uniref:OsmC family protein n=1 Tax=Talaromyces islandicus TaxID=28573 RepID=A0A0U1M4W8_TALIS|nr:hypothetical protein PISL3812_07647 [Talaromyces islandicus]
MLRIRPQSLAKGLNASIRPFSSSTGRQLIPVHISGQGNGTVQTITVPGKPFKFSTDAYTMMDGKESHPSPIAYSLASLSSCNQVTGSVVAKELGIEIGEWLITVEGKLPTEVFLGGEQGNPNWDSVALKVQVQSNLMGDHDPKFLHFAAEVERRCPMTALFKRSGVRYTSEWINKPLREASR